MAIEIKKIIQGGIRQMVMLNLENDLEGIAERDYMGWFKRYIYELKSKEFISEFEEKLLENEKLIYDACNKYKPQIQNNEEYGDLIQEALIILQNSIDKYKPVIKGRPVKFSSYLFLNLEGYLQQAFNEKFRLIKLTQTSFKNGDTKYVDFKLDDKDRSEVIENNFKTTTESQDQKLFLEELLVNLSDTDKKLINLHYYEGYSYSDMAKFYNCSKQHIGKQMINIINKIKGGL